LGKNYLIKSKKYQSFLSTFKVKVLKHRSQH